MTKSGRQLQKITFEPAVPTHVDGRAKGATASGASAKKMTPDPPLREALKGSSKFQNPEATWPGPPAKGRALGRRLFNCMICTSAEKSVININLYISDNVLTAVSFFTPERL